MQRTLADFTRFLILKKESDYEKTTQQQDKKHNCQEIEITLNKLPDRGTELVYKGCNQEKTG